MMRPRLPREPWVWEEGVRLWDSKKVESKGLEDQEDRVGWRDEKESEVSGLWSGNTGGAGADLGKLETMYISKHRGSLDVVCTPLCQNS